MILAKHAGFTCEVWDPGPQAGFLVLKEILAFSGLSVLQDCEDLPNLFCDFGDFGLRARLTYSVFTFFVNVYMSLSFRSPHVYV